MRGKAVVEWTAGLDLRLLNVGQAHESVGRENFSWAPAAVPARHVSGWRVAKETETLNDHRYIVMDVRPR